MNRQLQTPQDNSTPSPCPQGNTSWHHQPYVASSEPQLLPDKCLRTCARSKAQQGDYKSAIALLDQLINRHPDNAIDYNNRGLVFFQSGEMLSAIADYQTAIELNPNLASAYNNRANYYAALGELTAALADYERALDINPSYVRAWINRGITLRDLGDYKQAVENFDIAELLGQLQANIYAERGRTYHLWGDWNCAIADYHRALNQLTTESPTETSDRLRQQVETGLNQLLNNQR